MGGIAQRVSFLIILAPSNINSILCLWLPCNRGQAIGMYVSIEFFLTSGLTDYKLPNYPVVLVTIHL